MSEQLMRQAFEHIRDKRNSQLEASNNLTDKSKITNLHYVPFCEMWQAATAQAVPEGYVVVKPALNSAAKCKMIGEYTFRENDTDTLITVPWTTIKQIYKGGIECMIQAAQENK